MLSNGDNNADYKVKCLAMSAEHDIIPTACGKILLMSHLHTLWKKIIGVCYTRKYYFSLSSSKFHV